MDILAGLNFGLSVVIGLLLLVLLVVVHELGHAIAARRNGVVVEEFGIGFPPRAWARRLKNGVLFSLNWLPLGGFVKLQGEHDASTGQGDYGAASLWVKTKILLAGVAINWLVAAGLFGLLSLYGLPKIIPNQYYLPADGQVISEPVAVTTVVDGSPADRAGLRVGDEIIRFNGQPVEDPARLNQLTRDNRGEVVDIRYNRQAVEASVNVELRADNDDNSGYLGVGSAQRQLIRATWSAPLVGLATAAQLTWFTLDSLGQMMAQLATGLADRLQFFNPAAQQAADDKLEQVGANVAGPVGILGVIFPAAREAGLATLVMLTALVSLTLAVMNALPIPALDGGRWFTTVIFRLIKKPLTKELEEKINAAGFLILMGLIILVTIADIGKLGG